MEEKEDIGDIKPQAKKKEKKSSIYSWRSWLPALAMFEEIFQETLIICWEEDDMNLKGICAAFPK